MVRQVNIHMMPLIRRSHFTSDLRSLLPVPHGSGLPRMWLAVCSPAVPDDLRRFRVKTGKMSSGGHSPARKSQAVQSVTCGATSGRCHGSPCPTRIRARRPNVHAAVCRAPGPGSRRSEVLRTGRAAHARRTSGYRPAGLRREDPRTHRGRAIRLAAGPHRWWLALDRQAGPFGRKLFSLPNGRCASFQPSTPGSRPESSPRPTRRTAAQGHTGERL